MLINWFQSSYSPQNSRLNDAEINQLILKWCTNLLIVGVIKCLEANQSEFKVGLWSLSILKTTNHLVHLSEALKYPLKSIKLLSALIS